MAVVDKLVATAFGIVGILGLTDKIDEEESIDILTRIISKADEFESAIGEGGGGRRRLQSFGRNNNLFVAYIQISVLKLQGLDDTAILERLTGRFTERVVNIIAGVLDPAPATTTTTTTTTTSTTTTVTTVAPSIVAFQPGSSLSGSEFADARPIGAAFTPSRDIQITSLGVYDVGGDGLGNSHAVGIFNDPFSAVITPTPNTPLVSVTIPAGNPPAGSRFVANEIGGIGGTWFITLATPLTLNANTRYAIVGDNFGSELIFNSGATDFNIGQDLTFNGAFKLGPIGGSTITVTGAQILSVGNFILLGPNFEYN